MADKVRGAGEVCQGARGMDEGLVVAARREDGGKGRECCGAEEAVVVVLLGRERGQALDAVERERERADSVLLNVLPPVISERLKRTPQATLAERHDAVSVLFADLVGFTPLSTRMSPAETVALLNEIFSAFDAICQRHGVEKIKTIGDGYMVIAGAPDPMPDHALVMSRVAQEMMDFMATCPATAELELRIGLNAGEAVSAIVGTTRFHWDLWGDAINTAARMESHGVPGRIHLTDSFHTLIADQVPCEARGSIEVKGKGAMDTWFIA